MSPRRGRSKKHQKLPAKISSKTSIENIERSKDDDKSSPSSTKAEIQDVRRSSQRLSRACKIDNFCSNIKYEGDVELNDNPNVPVEKSLDNKDLIYIIGAEKLDVNICDSNSSGSTADLTSEQLHNLNIASKQEKGCKTNDLVFEKSNIPSLENIDNSAEFFVEKNNCLNHTGQSFIQRCDKPDSARNKKHIKMHVTKQCTTPERIKSNGSNTNRDSSPCRKQDSFNRTVCTGIGQIENIQNKSNSEVNNDNNFIVCSKKLAIFSESCTVVSNTESENRKCKKRKIDSSNDTKNKKCKIKSKPISTSTTSSTSETSKNLQCFISLDRNEGVSITTNISGVLENKFSIEDLVPMDSKIKSVNVSDDQALRNIGANEDTKAIVINKNVKETEINENLRIAKREKISSHRNSYKSSNTSKCSVSLNKSESVLVTTNNSEVLKNKFSSDDNVPTDSKIISVDVSDAQASSNIGVNEDIKETVINKDVIEREINENLRIGKKEKISSHRNAYKSSKTSKCSVSLNKSESVSVTTNNSKVLENKFSSDDIIPMDCKFKSVDVSDAQASSNIGANEDIKNTVINRDVKEEEIDEYSRIGKREKISSHRNSYKSSKTSKCSVSLNKRESVSTTTGIYENKFSREGNVNSSVDCKIKFNVAAAQTSCNIRKSEFIKEVVLYENSENNDIKENSKMTSHRKLSKVAVDQYCSNNNPSSFSNKAINDYVVTKSINHLNKRKELDRKKKLVEIHSNNENTKSFFQTDEECHFHEEVSLSHETSVLMLMNTMFKVRDILSNDEYFNDLLSKSKESLCQKDDVLPSTSETSVCKQIVNKSKEVPNDAYDVSVDHIDQDNLTCDLKVERNLNSQSDRNRSTISTVSDVNKSIPQVVHMDICEQNKNFELREEIFPCTPEKLGILECNSSQSNNKRVLNDNLHSYDADPGIEIANHLVSSKKPRNQLVQQESLLNSSRTNENEKFKLPQKTNEFSYAQTDKSGFTKKITLKRNYKEHADSGRKSFKDNIAVLKNPNDTVNPHTTIMNVNESLANISNMKGPGSNCKYITTRILQPKNCKPTKGNVTPQSYVTQFDNFSDNIKSVNQSPNQVCSQGVQEDIDDCLSLFAESLKSDITYPQFCGQKSGNSSLPSSEFPNFGLLKFNQSSHNIGKNTFIAPKNVRCTTQVKVNNVLTDSVNEPDVDVDDDDDDRFSYILSSLNRTPTEGYLIESQDDSLVEELSSLVEESSNTKMNGEPSVFPPPTSQEKGRKVLLPSPQSTEESVGISLPGCVESEQEQQNKALNQLPRQLSRCCFKYLKNGKCTTSVCRYTHSLSKTFHSEQDYKELIGFFVAREFGFALDQCLQKIVNIKKELFPIDSTELVENIIEYFSSCSRNREEIIRLIWNIVMSNATYWETLYQFHFAIVEMILKDELLCELWDIVDTSIHYFHCYFPTRLLNEILWFSVKCDDPKSAQMCVCITKFFHIIDKTKVDQAVFPVLADKLNSERLFEAAAVVERFLKEETDKQNAVTSQAKIMPVKEFVNSVEPEEIKYIKSQKIRKKIVYNEPPSSNSNVVASKCDLLWSSNKTIGLCGNDLKSDFQSSSEFCDNNDNIKCEIKSHNIIKLKRSNCLDNSVNTGHTNRSSDMKLIKSHNQVCTGNKTVAVHQQQQSFQIPMTKINNLEDASEDSGVLCNRTNMNLSTSSSSWNEDLSDSNIQSRTNKPVISKNVKMQHLNNSLTGTSTGISNASHILIKSPVYTESKLSCTHSGQNDICKRIHDIIAGLRAKMSMEEVAEACWGTWQKCNCNLIHFSKLLNSIEDIHKFYEDNYLYITYSTIGVNMMCNFVSKQKYQDAYRILALMIKKAVRPDIAIVKNSSGDKCYPLKITLFCCEVSILAGKVECAINLFESYNMLRPSADEWYSSAVIRDKELLNDALQFRNMICHKLMKTLLKNQEYHEATNLYRKVYLVQNCQWTPLDLVAYTNSIMVGLLNIKKDELAISFYEFVKKNFEILNFCAPTYYAFLEVLIQNGKISLAKAVYATAVFNKVFPRFYPQRRPLHIMISSKILPSIISFILDDAFASIALSHNVEELHKLMIESKPCIVLEEDSRIKPGEVEIPNRLKEYDGKIETTKQRIVSILKNLKPAIEILRNTGERFIFMEPKSFVDYVLSIK